MQGGSSGIVYGGLKYQASKQAPAAPSGTFFEPSALTTLSSLSALAGTVYRRRARGRQLDHLPRRDPQPQGGERGEGFGASVWKIPELNGQSNSPQLEQLFELSGHTGKIRRVIWWPLGKHDKLISIDDQNIFLWNVDMSNKSAKVISQGSADMLPNLSGGAWDPHNHNSIASISDSSLHLWDLRSMEKSSAIEHAHIRDVDYNPKKQHIIATTEDDFGICLWDLRMLKLPLKDLPGHSHWTWAIQHNPEYDELLLSAGTDSIVNLWLAKVSNNDSEPNSPSGSPNRQEEPLLNSYTDYEDSIYGTLQPSYFAYQLELREGITGLIKIVGIAWSSHDPSLFASLSYDGRVVLESVKPYLQRK
ncbi:hypothetical protein Zm00014a_018628 [Zea mays]|uniref:WD repeat-containing protein DWA2 n=1 Tax=Zea mays TaxID=4577 RepID=A0A3L6F7H0_MAIZE|nr:WD repeat-containing protein DWA2 [Zea mays]PWZ28961.1 hypothetical protein Zm00014a_018628 [Zea mays]